MSVLLRSGNWHYRFNYQKHICSGRCIGCTTERQAKAYEREMRRKAVEVYGHKTVKALVENYRAELAGTPAHRVAIGDALSLAPEASRNSRVRSAWIDFAEFMQTNYPTITDINLLTRTHVEAYIKHLAANGLYPAARNKSHRVLASATIRRHRRELAVVIAELKDHTALTENPATAAKIAMRHDNKFSRQIFTDAELERIYAHAKESPLIGVLFLVAGATGLTEGDICTLRWCEINWDTKLIQRKRRKTGADLVIPIMPQLEELLRSQPDTAGEYVFPELARRYLTNRPRLSKLVAAFIAECGISKCVDAGDHRVSVKDLHSMRHVFCYRAGKAGIPMATVQAIVGHMTPEMTKHYMAHASIQDRREAMMRMPGLFGTAANDTDARLERMAQEINALTPEERNKLMAMIR